MAIRTTLTTKGFAEYLERLTAAGAAVDTIAAEALAAGGEVLLAGMKRRVPKDTKNLEHKITMEGPFQDGNFIYVEVGLAGNVDKKTAIYGNVQEFGSANTPAQPYVRPTLDGDMGRARKAMKDVFLLKMEQL